jgi:hypothetical protein
VVIVAPEHEYQITEPAALNDEILTKANPANLPPSKILGVCSRCAHVVVEGTASCCASTKPAEVEAHTFNTLIDGTWPKLTNNTHPFCNMNLYAGWLPVAFTCTSTESGDATLSFL